MMNPKLHEDYDKLLEVLVSRLGENVNVVNINELVQETKFSRSTIVKLAEQIHDSKPKIIDFRSNGAIIKATSYTKDFLMNGGFKKINSESSKTKLIDNSKQWLSIILAFIAILVSIYINYVKLEKVKSDMNLKIDNLIKNSNHQIEINNDSQRKIDSCINLLSKKNYQSDK